MTSERQAPANNPLIRISKSRSELVWPDGSRRTFRTPAIEQAQKTLNLVMSVPKLGPRASPEQIQNRADDIFEARTQLGHAVRSFVSSNQGDLHSFSYQSL
ncbi:hypothetical protein FB472_0035 [Rhodoglobus vestalii]|uniref:Uncharacterized protein n=1 Tax=Rhodoglobus vestalii TaxID=193384 RepID=A0A8H2PX74_9MICO|nr:hypothetical protein FB472_0035 [Rhodoglobus vestalii]